MNFLPPGVGWGPCCQPELCAGPSPPGVRGAAPAGPRWRFTAELTGMPGAGWPSGATGNSSHSGIIRKRVCLSQAGGRGHRRLVRACLCRGRLGVLRSCPGAGVYVGTGFAQLRGAGLAVRLVLQVISCQHAPYGSQTDPRGGAVVLCGCSLLREAPSRGKEVTSQLLRPGQIPGVFLKEAGCGEKPPGLCVRRQPSSGGRSDDTQHLWREAVTATVRGTMLFWGHSAGTGPHSASLVPASPAAPLHSALPGDYGFILSDHTTKPGQ